MQIVRNELDGLYACPLDHPDTCANPKGFWKIEEIKIEMRDNKPLIWVRGIKSMWFRADQCYIADDWDCEQYSRHLRQQEILNSLTFSYET